MPPRAEYETRRADRQGVAAALSVRHTYIAHARLATFLTIFPVGWLVFGPQLLSPWWLLAPVAGFIALAFWHDSVRRTWQRAADAVAFYDRGLARLDDRWAGTGTQGQQFANPDHLYAADLDLYGPGSLFERLCTARTGMGEVTLADWLLAPATPAVVRARQEPVAALRPQLDWLETLAGLGRDVRYTGQPQGPP